jgi:hypothetical protein
MRGLINTVLVMACAAVGATAYHVKPTPQADPVFITATDTPIVTPAVYRSPQCPLGCDCAKCACKAGECGVSAKPAVRQTTIPNIPAKPVANRSQCANGSCALPKSGSCASGSCATQQSAGPVRRVFQNRPRVFRRWR